MNTWIDSILDRLFALSGGLLAMQFPAFIQQYTQRVSASYQELNVHLAQIQQFAQSNGKTLNQYIQKFVLSGDPDFINQGEFILQLMTRIQNLKQQIVQLEGAHWLSRPFYFIWNFDGQIVKATMDHFQPGLQFSAETLGYTLIGAACGIGVYFIFKKITSRIFIYAKNS